MAAEPTTTPRSELPDVSDEVERLRGLERQHATEEAWSWITHLQQQLQGNRPGAEDATAALFAAGEPSRGIDGQTDGMLVGWVAPRPFTRVLRPITRVWLPWQGKHFVAAEDRGTNLLTRSARLPAKLPWPLYRTRPAENGRWAFEFETRVEPDALGGAQDVLVIDYKPVKDNPRLIIRSVRDELVWVAGGAHIGRVLLRMPNGSHHNTAYFALREQG
jgi:hypothetical protein